MLLCLPLDFFESCRMLLEETSTMALPLGARTRKTLHPQTRNLERAWHSQTRPLVAVPGCPLQVKSEAFLFVAIKEQCKSQVKQQGRETKPEQGCGDVERFAIKQKKKSHICTSKTRLCAVRAMRDSTAQGIAANISSSSYCKLL